MTWRTTRSLALMLTLAGCDDPDAGCGPRCQVARDVCDDKYRQGRELNDLDRERLVISKETHKRIAHVLLLMNANCRVDAKHRHGER